MTQAWRIVKAKYADTAFDGEGARVYGGRWSSAGTRAVYVAQSLSLATLEILIHLQQTAILTDYVFFTVEFPEACLSVLSEVNLPKKWRDFPTPAANQEIGDRWIRSAASLVLRVPSAITVHEANYLINPAHPDFSRLTVSSAMPLDIDPRVLKR
jgi:RES domain-containing protein